MTISYVNFMKHAQQVTKTSSNSRPVLKGVMHRDGNLIVTDSHRLYLAKEMYEGQEKNVDPKTGSLIEGNYPDVDRLIPELHDAKLSVEMDSAEFQKITKLIVDALKIDKFSHNIEIVFENKFLTFKTPVESKVLVSYEVLAKESTDDFKMTLNAKYLADAAALMKDADNKVNFNFYSPLRPMTLTTHNLVALILPIRNY